MGSAQRSAAVFLECYTELQTDLHRRAQRTGDHPLIIKPITQGDRNQRRQEFKERSANIEVEGPGEPANCTSDAVQAMWQEQDLEWLPPQKCPSRDTEVKFYKKYPRGAEGEKMEKRRTPQADIDTKLDLYEALDRRGVTLEEWGLCPRKRHHALFTKRYKEALNQDSPAEHWVRPTLKMILTCDEWVWGQAAKDTRGRVRRQPAMQGDEEYLVPASFVKWIASTEVTQLLGCRYVMDISSDKGEPPRRFPQDSPATGITAKSKAARQRQNKRLQIEQLKGQAAAHKAGQTRPWEPARSSSKGNGKRRNQDQSAGQRQKGTGKGSGKGRMPDTSLPLDLQGHGCASETPTKQKRICFGFNQGKCPHKGTQCERGLHVCMKCFQGHPFLSQCPQGPRQSQ